MKKQSGALLIRTALRVLGYQVIFGFFGFMLTPSLIGASDWIRLPLIGALVLGAGALMFMDGSYRGEKEYGQAKTLERLTAQGQYAATASEEAGRFSRSRAALASALGVAPILIMAVIVAVSAKPYVYTVQGVPGWLGSYIQRPEIGSALAYADASTAQVALADYLRIAVRFILFPYIGLLGAMSDTASYWFDRLCPLIALLMPAVMAIGYQFGPIRHAKNEKAIKEAIRKPRKRLKKSRVAPRRQPEKKQLI